MSRINDGLYSSSAHDWKTPPDFIEKLLTIIDIPKFDLDPCCTFTEIPAHFHYQGHKVDGLKQVWDVWGGIAPSHVFVNPPYGTVLPKWVKKMWWEGTIMPPGPGATTHVWGLIPARTCTKYWHTDIFTHAVVFFIEGRLKFLYGTEQARMEAIIERHKKLCEKWEKKHGEIIDGDTGQLLGVQAEKDIDNGTAPFPTALIYWGRDWRKYARLLRHQKLIKGTVMINGGCID